MIATTLFKRAIHRELGVASLFLYLAGCTHQGPRTKTRAPSPNDPVQITNKHTPAPSEPAQSTLHPPTPSKAVIAGPRSQILVLGTTHLGGKKESFDPKAMNLLLAKLEAWKPDRIAIERHSGLQCDLFLKHKELFGGESFTNCLDTASAREATGLDVLAATLKLEEQGPIDPKSLDPRSQKERIAQYMAAGEHISAFVHWLHLKPEDQVPEATLNAAMIAQLKKIEARHSEDTVLAAELARRLGHDRVFQVDDATYRRPLIPHVTDITKAQRRIWAKASNTPEGQEREQAIAQWETIYQSPQGIVDFYKMLNEPRQERVIFLSDFGAALQDAEDKHYGRYYVAGWETRNLRMVANLREIMIDKPGVKVLTIVGQSHKFYYENYLRQMHDIEIVDANAILQASTR